MMPTALINVKNTPNYRKAGQDLIDLRFEGTRVTYDSGKTDGISENGYMDGLVNGAGARLSFVLNTEERNTTSAVTAFFRGAGYALQGNAFDQCLLDGTCYGVKLMPTVKSLSSNSGFANGGQNLTITGTSLDGAVTVTVDGLPCTVREVTSSYVVCTTTLKEMPPLPVVEDATTTDTTDTTATDGTTTADGTATGDTGTTSTDSTGTTTTDGTTADGTTADGTTADGTTDIVVEAPPSSYIG